MEEKMDTKIEGIKREVDKLVERIKIIEQKTKDLECDLMERNRKLQEQILMMDCKLLDNYLRFRGVPESQERGDD